MRIRIMGKSWTLVWVPKGESVFKKGESKPVMNTQDKGSTEAPEVKGKSIYLREGLPAELELDTIIHELLHASAYHLLDETWVQSAATDIARILTRLGYRR